MGYQVLGRFDGTRGLKSLKSYKTTDDRAQNFLGKWKVFVSKADGAAGQLGNPIPARIIGKAELGDPMTLCTETFLAIGPFATEHEAKIVIKYAATKFFQVSGRSTQIEKHDARHLFFCSPQDFPPHPPQRHRLE